MPSNPARLALPLVGLVLLAGASCRREEHPSPGPAVSKLTANAPAPSASSVEIRSAKVTPTTPAELGDAKEVDAGSKLPRLALIRPPKLLDATSVEVGGLAWAGRWALLLRPDGYSKTTPAIWTADAESGALSKLTALGDRPYFEALASGAGPGYARVFTKGKGPYGNIQRELWVTTAGGKSIALGTPPAWDQRALSVNSAWSTFEPASGVVTWIATRDAARHAKNWWREVRYGYFALGPTGAKAVTLGEIPRTAEHRRLRYLVAVANERHRAAVIAMEDGDQLTSELVVLDRDGTPKSRTRLKAAMDSSRGSVAAMARGGTTVVASRVDTKEPGGAQLRLIIFAPGNKPRVRDLPDAIGLAEGLAITACGPSLLIAATAQTAPKAARQVTVFRYVPGRDDDVDTLAGPAPDAGRSLFIACGGDRVAVVYAAAAKHWALAEVAVH